MTNNPFAYDINNFQQDDFQIANPGAGLQFAQTVEASNRWRLAAVNFLFTTDANAANRLVCLQIKLGAAVLAELCAPILQTASNAWTYRWVIGQPEHDHSTNHDIVCCALPELLFSNNPLTLNSNIKNIQATDAMTTIIVLTHRWLI